jgi:hypothetical protein
MAIYHCTTKPLSRSAGRSAPAAAAYRSGEKIRDERTDKLHDYTNRSGVIDSYTLLPSGESCDRSELWNAAEAAEKRKDARTAREWIVAIPDELVPKTKLDKLWDGNPDQELVKEFAQHLSKTFDVAVDVAIHSPDEKGDKRNYHAHILTTTRQAKLDNGKIALGDKATLELSDKKRGELKLGKAKTEVKNIREVWADLANKKLEEQQKDVRIDHRSLQDQGIDRLPQIHVGVTANNMERKNKPTERGQCNNEIKQLNAEIIHLEAIRERQKEVERMQSALREEKRKQEQQKKKQQKEREEQQRRQKAEQEKQEQQQEAEKLSPENITPQMIEQTYQGLVDAAKQTINQQEQKTGALLNKLESEREQHRLAEPEKPTGLFASFKYKSFEVDHAVWATKKRHIQNRIDKVFKEFGSWRNAHPGPIADQQLKKQHPKLHTERERLKELEREKLDREREARRKEREQARRRSRSRGRGRGNGGLSR